MRRIARYLGCLAVLMLVLSVGTVRAQSSDRASSRMSDNSPDWSTQFVAQPAVEPAVEPNPPPPRPAPRPTRTSARDSYVRLARAPNMFGDTLRPVGSLSLKPEGQSVDRQPLDYNLMLGGGASYNAAHNNRAAPTDRAYFLYNGFYNAVNYAQPGAIPPYGSADLHLYTAGVEKTFLDGTWSLDLRMPFTNGFNLVTNDFATDSGRIGNLSAFLKHLAYEDDAIALSGGLGFGLPTGSDVVSSTLYSTLTLQNEAIHVMPFVAMTASPNDNWFIQAFAQIDFAATGNEVVADNVGIGKYTEQNLLHLDATLGRWLVQDLDRYYLNGIAAIVELHYTSTLNNSDQVFVSSLSGNGFIGNPLNRLDLLNLTSGLHFQISELSNLRVGAVVPLRAQPERVFDSEIQVSFNRMF